jgi:hypothetical protein
MTVELASVVERRLGALPASAEFLRRLDVAGIIDELCPVRDVAHLTHGQVIEALVANRLSSPASMVRVADWARKWAVEEAFGVDPELLNDDRLARALDAIAPHPADLIQAQRRFDTAHQAVVTVSGRPGRIDTWPPEAVTELYRLREEEREATLALYDARDGTPFAPYEQQKRIQAAARTNDDTADHPAS